MEGPSLVILTEELKSFTGKRIEGAFGSSNIDYSKITGSKIKAFKSWGKHFLIVLEDVTIRIHFLMFGSYRINERKNANPRLSLQLENGDELNFYTTAVRLLEENFRHAIRLVGRCNERPMERTESKKKAKSFT